MHKVRKDEQRRLYEEGDIEAAGALKKTRYNLYTRITPKVPVKMAKVRFTENGERVLMKN